MAEGAIARIGRWCFRRRWWVLAIWLVAVVAGGLSAGPVFESLTSGGGPASLESVQASNVLKQGSDTGGTVVGLLDQINPEDPAVRAAVSTTASGIAGISGVEKVDTPYESGLSPARSRAFVATDGKGLLVQATLTNLTGTQRATTVDAVAARLHGLQTTLNQAGQSSAKVSVGGGLMINRQANQQAQTDLSRAEELSLPITLVILIFVFGGIIAAGMPVIAAVISIAASMAALLAFSKVTDLNQNAVTVVTLLGLGLSVDYGLLLVARYREELAGGFEPIEAVARAWATAGRTILFSALTVAAALTGLLMFGISGLSALGAAGVSIAVVAMLVSLTLTSAMLGLARNRIKPSRRAARRTARYGDAAEVGFFAGLARITQRRPVLTVVVTSAALLAAGTPLLSLKVHLDDLSGLPRSLESVQVVDVLADRFGQAPAPAVTVVARTDAASLDTWAAGFTGTAGVTRVYPARKVGPNLATVSIDAAGDPQGPTAIDLVERVRANRPPGVRSWVTGGAAVLDDVLGLIEQRLPWAVGLTLLAMALLLFAMTGSLVVPVKAILMNLVSLGATFGVLSAVFEHGFMSGPLHTLKVGGLDPFVLVSVFAFAFGLSMDYEVFLLARIKEYADRGLPTDYAVRRGLQHSGRIITSAALLMVIVFSCFVTGRIGTVQQIGLGLAVAVAIDATVVRCVLVPATMTLLGTRNWWAPAWLRRVHQRIGLREAVLPTAPAAHVPSQRSPEPAVEPALG